MYLSKNFTLEELTASDTAERMGIDNEPDDTVIANLKFLCEKVLQPIRDEFGPVIILSGYRSYPLNLAIGGSKSSQHCSGQAADLRFVNASIVDVAKWIKKTGLIVDQCIVEGYNAKNPAKGWLHVSVTNGANRNAFLTATFTNGRATYTGGIPA